MIAIDELYLSRKKAMNPILNWAFSCIKKFTTEGFVVFQTVLAGMMYNSIKISCYKRKGAVNYYIT